MGVGGGGAARDDGAGGDRGKSKEEEPAAGDGDPKSAVLDNPLHALGFQFDIPLTARLVSGRLTVTPICCQPFGMLHGGISGLIAEALASLGAQVASGFSRVAGIHLNVNHLKAARVGDRILAEATPVSVSRTVQVWKICLWKLDSSDAKGVMISCSTVTVLCNLPATEGTEEVLLRLTKSSKI